MDDALVELGQWLLLLTLVIGQHLSERKLASTKYQLDELHERVDAARESNGDVDGE